MNDKIINGIDVSECNAYKDKHCKNETSIMFTEYNLCSNFPNCYFKQLKRLQQQIEAYQLSKNEAKEIIAELKYKNKELKKENEELKEKNKNYAKLMLEQQEISRKYWECIGKIKQAIEVLAETCNVYPLKTNLDKLITTIKEVLNDRD